MSSLILINGEEEFLKERAAVDEAKSRLIDDISVFDYTNIEKYEDEINLVSLSGSPRAFIILNAKSIPTIPTGDDVLIVVSGKTKLEHEKAIMILDFPKLKTYDNNNQVVKWIIDEGKKLNIDLTSVASALFITNGKSLRKLSSEINKLSVITPKGAMVKPSEARSIVSFSTELTPKDVLDPMCCGNTKKALAFYDRLQELNDETGWIIAYIQRFLINQIKSNLLAKRGLPNKDIALNIGMHPFIFKQVHEDKISTWNTEFLISSLDRICKLDLLHKKGEQVAKVGLELEIINLSESTRRG